MLILIHVMVRLHYVAKYFTLKIETNYKNINTPPTLTPIGMKTSQHKHVSIIPYYKTIMKS